MMFPAVERAAKVLFRGKFARLAPNEVDGFIRPVLDQKYASNQPAIDAGLRLLAGMKEGINAAQPYRNGQEQQEPAELPSDFVIAHLSAGATYLWWMIELCSTYGQGIMCRRLFRKTIQAIIRGLLDIPAFQITRIPIGVWQPVTVLATLSGLSFVLFCSSRARIAVIVRSPLVDPQSANPAEKRMSDEQCSRSDLKKLPPVRPETLAVTHLEMIRDNQVLYPATGFLYRHGQTLALVSCWHVFTGINPNTKKVRGYPNKVRFHINVWDRATETLEFKPIELELAKKDNVTWWQHPYEGCKIDIAVLPLNERLGQIDNRIENIRAIPAQLAIKNDAEGKPYATYAYPWIGSEVFILGYPRGLMRQGIFPIWKRGSIASEPMVDIMDGPIILVDALTREGMSGAAVLYFGTDLVTMEGPEQMPPSQHPWLVGVYAGREGVTREEVDMALGRIWKRHFLDEIFYHRKPGD